jgi:hypothetical protein
VRQGAPYAHTPTALRTLTLRTLTRPPARASACSLAWSYCFDHSARCREHAGRVSTLEFLAWAASACAALLTAAGVVLCVRRCVRRRRGAAVGGGDAGGMGAMRALWVRCRLALCDAGGVPHAGWREPLLGGAAAGEGAAGEEGSPPQLCLVEDALHVHNDDGPPVPPGSASKALTQAALAQAALDVRALSTRGGAGPSQALQSGAEPRGAPC